MDIQNDRSFSLYRMLKYFVLLIVGLWLFSCQDPYENSTFTAYEELPVSSLLESRSDDFSLWVELLKHTQLFSTLNLNTEYTVFAPNNDAMNGYLESKGVSSVEELDVDEAIILVKYHVLHGRTIKQNEFTTGAIDWPTATDDKLTISFQEGGLIYVNSNSLIVESDIVVTNGVVHAIDKVLIPVTATIYNQIESNDYSIMREAVEVTGYNTMLNKVSEDILDPNGQPAVKRFFYTLFAVSDEVYNSNGINSFSDLVDELGVEDNNYADPANPLNIYVAYHILDQLRSTDDLSVSDDDSTKNINTMADKELINISKTETNLMRINYDFETGNGVHIIDGDIPCKNGVIHAVDNWMPVKTPPATVVLWDLTDYAELASVSKYFQSANPNGGHSTYYKYLEIDEIGTYIWETVPSELFGAVIYVNNRQNDGIYYFTENYDHLRLQLGIGGWVEMKTPVIVKGNYKVTIAYISYFSSATAGEMQCYLDGEKLGSSFAISNSNQDGLATRVLTNSVVFSETDNHTFRIVGIDGRRLTLDYVLFEPIN
ncbi:MAG: fasciclin domain-containing protein [Prolixibacteraceae bacterium]|nr:fasciclin domain-containing protein [Prolixibacteraceae bacterium]